MTFTQEHLSNFRRYRKVQMGGRFNMFDPRARAATSLSREDYLFVIENYTELQTAQAEQEKEEATQ